jgi:3-phenylpropionate/trans-cinnamate dioxygenase ferredoxin reductase subunit
MSAEQRTYVIVGGGLAGAKAAETLRSEGFDGRVVLVAEERELPYERPPLSKDYLQGKSEREAARVHDEGFYEANQIELLMGRRALALDPTGHAIELDGGERLGYERMLLATGAEPRRLEIPGAELAGVRYLRTLPDSDALRDHLAGTPRLAVVGAGWIGCEIAASARQMGCDVTIVEPASVPLERVLGPEVGQVYLKLHQDNGVRVLTGTGVEEFEGSDSVSAVRTSGGERLECDLVVVGIGVLPRVELAAAAGLAIEDGVAVDAHLRTSAPDVFAAGDIASAEHPRYPGRVRVEHWANALNQGPAAARSMLGSGEPYARLPYFFSDQFDLGMEYTGLAREWDEVVFRGDVEAREFIAFWLSAGRVVAGMNANVWDVTDDIKALIESDRQVDVRRLADPEVPLQALTADDPPG